MAQDATIDEMNKAIKWYRIRAKPYEQMERSNRRVKREVKAHEFDEEQYKQNTNKAN